MKSLQREFHHLWAKANHKTPKTRITFRYHLEIFFISNKSVIYVIICHNVFSFITIYTIHLSILKLFISVIDLYYIYKKDGKRNIHFI